jgi:UDP-3-O-[3-hydroxymyristoyl] glucosamine N-acyltransferase
VGPNAVIAPGVTVGAHTLLHARVALQQGVRVGSRCVVFPGAVVGADGFGFLPGPEGPVKVPHLGGVTVGDRVEIGANTTIDRGKFDDTVIGDDSKIDNQVQIAHACKLGRGVIICGCAAIGGSVTIGDGAVLAGHVSVRDNVTIAPGAVVGGNSAIDGDVDATEPWFGYPARPISTASRNYAALTKLGEMWGALRDVRRRVGKLEERDT